MPLLRPLSIRQSRMQNGNLVAEHLVQIRRHRRCQTNFRNQQNRRPPLIQHLAHASQVHGRLARSRDAMQQQAAELARGNGLDNLRERIFLCRTELELKRRLPRLEPGARPVLRFIHQLNQPAPHQRAQSSARNIQPMQSFDGNPPARSRERLNQSTLILVKLRSARVGTGASPVRWRRSLRRQQHRDLHQTRRIPSRRHILASNPLLPHHPREQRLRNPSRPAQTPFTHAIPLRQIIEHAKFNQLLLRRPLRPRRRPRHPRQMQRHPPLIRDAIHDRAFKFGGERQHGAKHFTHRREIVIGNPLPKFQQLFIENRREVERLDDFFRLHLRRTVMQLNHNTRQPLLPKRHQHAPANYRFHPRRNRVGEHHVERHGEGDVAEERHVGD